MSYSNKPSSIQNTPNYTVADRQYKSRWDEIFQRDLEEDYNKSKSQEEHHQNETTDQCRRS